jgi:hypothetical protein
LARKSSQDAMQGIFCDFIWLNLPRKYKRSLLNENMNIFNEIVQLMAPDRIA